jgi:DNA processing protein
MASAEKALSRGARAALMPIPWNDPRTPASFHHIVDPPPVLWVRGGINWIDLPAVAIVGSRAGTPYALMVADRLAADLAARGVVVVSGLARGVDAAAHQGALAADGLTVAVLGCGADRVYPAEHKTLASAIAAHGAVVSEFAPGTPPAAVFFPRRNRIISALARAVVVVEAGEKSGSLITARCALEQNRDVLAVPGNVLTGRNRGGHALIRDGARLVESADDVLEQLGLERCVPAPGPTVVSDPVLASLGCAEPLELDQISAQTGLPVPGLLARLLDLELQGVVRRTEGGRFVRI